MSAGCIRERGRGRQGDPRWRASGKNQPPKDEGRGLREMLERESEKSDSARGQVCRREREKGKDAGPTKRIEGREDRERRRR